MFLNSPTTILLTALSLSSSALGACRDHRDIALRRRAASSTKASASTSASSSSSTSTSSSSSTAECAYYDFPVADQIAPNYPAIWVNAKIVANDTEALAVFKALEPLIPNIEPKGTPDGNFSASSKYDTAKDPDCWWTDTLCTTPKTPGLLPDIVSCEENNVLGLTYDDGPNCSHNAFYDFLLAQNQKASMFFIGSNVFDWPKEAQRALTDGHEICVHTWSHPYMTGMTNEGVFAELWYTKKLIKEIVGVTVQCWRPPFGDIDDRVRFIGQALDLKPVIWLEDTDDWNYAAIGISGVETNYENIIKKGQNGTYNSGFGPIMLSHEIDGTTMEEAEKFVPQLEKAYAHVMPVNVCRNNTKPYVEQNVVYPDFAQYVAGTTTISGNPAPTADGSASVPFPWSSGQPFPTAIAYDLATSGPQPTTTTTTTTTTVASATSKSGNASGSHTSSGAKSSATGVGSQNDAQKSGSERVVIGGLMSLTSLLMGLMMV